MKSKPITYETLQPQEVQMLPQRIRVRLGEDTDEHDEWIVFHASWPLSDIVDRLNRLGSVPRMHPWCPNSAADLDRILTWLAADRSDVEQDLAIDNLAARRDYLDDTPTLTAGQIHDMSGLASRNKGEPASRWKKEGRTFAVRLGRRDLFPAFQFEDGRPRTVVRHVLAALPAGMTPWQTAFWFASGNGWLDGDEPQQRLGDTHRVVEAARRLSEPAIG